MRFLCLHGLGTNMALRYEMGDEHTFDFVEGTIPAPIAPDMKAYTGHNDTCYVYYNSDDIPSIGSALSNLHSYLLSEGPYDGVLAYSHGASLAATYITQQTTLNAPLPFKCAIFLSGNLPADPVALERGQVRPLDPVQDEVRLKLPTAHIWGVNDDLYPGTSERLSGMCDDRLKTVFLHEEGHNVPSVPNLKNSVNSAQSKY
ncbi:hypothetical protein K469DRAFT_722959 [Zopfia rhizophila CBS 207.26]|uniref:Serine hydrolase domain-containing protein n=1 Tax=Zopfia rhizophila CBS 207.26 TaxID=1314779 RepID=A0A6A6EFF7_9PEZI|nr:hypothetical protein K469DRAFT_722959 [Zopfia rhizophila CBS 207.26]